MLTRPDFSAVAKIIADPPPAWLAAYLEQFSGFIRNEHLSKEEYQWAKQNIERMHYSIDHLIRWLPILAGVPGLGSFPDVADDVVIAIGALDRLKAELNRRPLPDGRPPNVMQQCCADVVVEAWKDIHDNVKPRSDEVLEACAAYWVACGQPERDAGNWWRNTEHAVANPNKLVRTLLNVHKTRT
jgi:hypothetical protein